MDVIKTLLFLLLFLSINFSVAAATPNPCAVDSYSLQCIHYLNTGDEAKKSAWMKTAVMQIITALEQYPQNILPAYKTCGYTDIRCRAKINLAIEQIVKPVFDQIVKSGNRPYLKSIGFATSDNTYVAIYNCTSPYEQKSLKICDTGIKSFIGVKVFDDNSGLQIRGYDDGNYQAQLITSLPQAFVPNTRPWYKDTLQYAPAEKAFATGIYPNYFTGHAVSGFTAKSKNSRYIALVLTYIADRK